MALNVYIALTVFPRRHPTPEIWLTVQPYVAPDDLPAWLDAIQGDGSMPGITYTMLVDKLADPNTPGGTRHFSLTTISQNLSR